MNSNKFVAVLVISSILTACGGEDAMLTSGTVIDPNAQITPTPSPSASPSPSPSVSPSPSPSPSPSASPTPYAFGGGVGSQADPYQLDTATDVDHIRDFPAAYYTLTQDINMNGVAFQPITLFSGVIYGNLNEIQNLTAAQAGSTTAGFITTLTGTLVQVKFRDVVFTGAAYASLVSHVGSTGLISACTLEGVMTSPSGGNGYNTGVGNPVFKTKHANASIIGFGPNNLQAYNVDVMFNGNRVILLCSGAMCGSAGL